MGSVDVKQYERGRLEGRGGRRRDWGYRGQKRIFCSLFPLLFFFTVGRALSALGLYQNGIRTRTALRIRLLNANLHSKPFGHVENRIFHSRVREELSEATLADPVIGLAGVATVSHVIMLPRASVQF